MSENIVTVVVTNQHRNREVRVLVGDLPESGGFWCRETHPGVMSDNQHPSLWSETDCDVCAGSDPTGSVFCPVCDYCCGC